MSAGQPYQDALRVLDEQKVGWFFWELMIAKTQFKAWQGLIYPDGTVRDPEAIAYISGKTPETIEFDVKPDEEIIRVLVTIFHELRNGQSLDGRSTDRLASAVMSTAEAVSVAHAMGVYAYYYREGRMVAEDFTDFLVGAAIKDNVTDLKRMNHYFETEVALKKGAAWETVSRRWRESFRC